MTQLQKAMLFLAGAGITTIVIAGNAEEPATETKTTDEEGKVVKPEEGEKPNTATAKTPKKTTKKAKKATKPAK